VDVPNEQYIAAVVGRYLPHVEQWAAQRRANYRYLEGIFGEAGYVTRFKLEDSYVPGVFMFRVPLGVSAQGVKEGLQKNGVEASVFYREDSVFVPVHHRLTAGVMDYFLAVVKAKAAEGRP